jgi:hypothetical protein
MVAGVTTEGILSSLHFPYFLIAGRQEGLII